jgi:hypothetical protein
MAEERRIGFHLFERMGAKLDKWLAERKVIARQAKNDKFIALQQAFLDTLVFTAENHRSEPLTLGRELTVRDFKTVGAEQHYFEVSLLCSDPVGRWFLVEYVDGVGRCTFKPCQRDVMDRRVNGRLA